MKLIIFLFLNASLVFASSDIAESKKIELLLKKIKDSQVIFIRNKTEHTASEAYDHLKMKLNTAQSSWFAPDKDEWTAKMFIEKIASESSFSGRPYKIKLKNGTVIKSQKWLQQILLKIEK